MEKKTKKVAEKTTITLYSQDFEVTKREDEILKNVNESKFNLSAFVRHCLRNENIMKIYRETSEYRNER